MDVLSNGRLRLGIGLGWNEVEYTALNEEFHNRGRRMDEQIEVLVKLWTDPLVTYHGRYHTIPDAGLNPMPVQQPIPLWFGGHAEPVMRRIARWGAGWMPNYRTAAEAQATLAILDRYLAAEGRSRSDLGIEARISYGGARPEEWEQTIAAWRAEGVTHLTVNTMGGGLTRPDQHIQALRHFAETMLPAAA